MSNFTNFRSLSQFECGTCDHIGYADISDVPTVSGAVQFLHCEACGETLTELDSLSDEDELPDIEFGAFDSDEDSYDFDFGEVD